MVHIKWHASSFYEAQRGEFILEAEELPKMRETIVRVLEYSEIQMISGIAQLEQHRYNSPYSNKKKRRIKTKF